MPAGIETFYSTWVGELLLQIPYSETYCVLYGRIAFHIHGGREERIWTPDRGENLELRFTVGRGHHTVTPGRQAGIRDLPGLRGVGSC